MVEEMVEGWLKRWLKRWLKDGYLENHSVTSTI